MTAAGQDIAVRARALLPELRRDLESLIRIPSVSVPGRIDEPLLAGMARPTDLEELTWLREQGVELLISLTEEPPRRDWINDAGLFIMHVPIIDLTAPTQEQLDQIVTAIR